MSSMGILSTSMGIRAISPLPEVTGMGKTHCMGNRASSPLPKKKAFSALCFCRYNSKTRKVWSERAAVG
jgi:hypothetical protein